ncbi:hypothetical protein JCM19239_2430 [Vibrio variabilis]|uniref:Uncharacterized protein n=1 Tax=Vibrio variabilis TaxID=990271 RepID=A0ABQ0JRG9_9VIBR|nr:hypothetical protein JCM19239_2430 [Vibrio variabilis]
MTISPPGVVVKMAPSNLATAFPDSASEDANTTENTAAEYEY